MRPENAVTPSETPSGGEVRCKLLRDDGSEWTVTDLSLEPAGLRVSGYRYIREGHTAAEARRDVIRDEPLRASDRVHCLNRKGNVVWVLARPGATDGPRRHEVAPDG